MSRNIFALWLFLYRILGLKTKHYQSKGDVASGLIHIRNCYQTHQSMLLAFVKVRCSVHEFYGLGLPNRSRSLRNSQHPMKEIFTGDKIPLQLCTLVQYL